jgi:hypothetical protein
MSYQLYESPIHGKIIGKGKSPAVFNKHQALQMAETYQGKTISAGGGRYMVSVPEWANSLAECECGGDGQPAMAMMQLRPETYNQGDVSYQDHEVQMARQELYRTAKLSLMLHEILKNVDERQGLEGWVQAKLTRAADYIETVAAYLDYEMRNPTPQMMEDPIGSAQQAAGQQQTVQTTQATMPGQPTNPNDAKTKTPGMVKMAKIDTNGKIQGAPILVPAAQVRSRQQSGFHVIGESASAGASSAGGVASSMGGGNGFLNGGPGTMQRRGKKRKKTTEAWDMMDPTKPYALSNPRILYVTDDLQGIYDFAVSGNNVLSIRPFNGNQWDNMQRDARNHGYMLKYVGKDPQKAKIAHAGDTPQTGRNMRGEKI